MNVLTAKQAHTRKGLTKAFGKDGNKRHVTASGGICTPARTLTMKRRSMVFACHEASCRPPTSGGTGGSKGGGGSLASRIKALGVRTTTSTDEHGDESTEFRTTTSSGHKVIAYADNVNGRHDLLIYPPSGREIGRFRVEGSHRAAPTAGTVLKIAESIERDGAEAAVAAIKKNGNTWVGL